MNKFRMLILASVLVSAGILPAKETKGTGVQNTGSGMSGTVSAANYSHQISPSQVNNTGRYVVKTSGYFFLTEDLHFYPKNFATNATNDDATLGADDERAAIYIEADNVVLDLNNKSITMNNSKKPADLINATGVDAIVVKGGCQNVTIKNGTIGYSTGYGIHVLDGAADGATSNVTMSNLNIMNCPLGGILVGKGALNDSGKLTFGISINNVNISNCQGTVRYGAAGTATYTGGDGNARGIILDKVAQAHILHCSCSNNHIDTTANSTSTAASDATGVYIVDSQNVEVMNCSLNNNQAYKSYGLHVETSENVHVMESKMLNNQILKKATVPADATAEAAGARLNASSFCLFETCEASNNSLADEALTKFGVGFLVDGRTDPSNNNSFHNCLAAGNVGGAAEAAGAVDDPTAGAIGAGFLSIGQAVLGNLNTGNQYFRCAAKGNLCGTAGTAQQRSALGIGLIYSDSAEVRECLCIANGGIAAANTRGVGLLLGPLGLGSTEVGGSALTEAYTRNAIVRRNWLASNTWHGVYDMAVDSQSLFMENYAFRNGIANAAYSEGHQTSGNLNFKVAYEQSNENLPLASGTVGGFGAFNVAGRYVNNEIQVTADSLLPGDTGYPFMPADDVA